MKVIVKNAVPRDEILSHLPKKYAAKFSLLSFEQSNYTLVYFSSEHLVSAKDVEKALKRVIGGAKAILVSRIFSKEASLLARKSGHQVLSHSFVEHSEASKEKFKIWRGASAKRPDWET